MMLLAGGGITKEEEIKREGETLQPAFRKKFHHKKEKFSPISMIPKLIEFVKPY